MSKRILVVDDDADTTAMLVMYLQSLGHEVHCAADGEEAVATSRNFHPDVILLDLGLPRLNGLAAAREIRRFALEPRPLIVATTGYGGVNHRMASDEAGIDIHLVKPVDLDVLERLMAAESIESPA